MVPGSGARDSSPAPQGMPFNPMGFRLSNIID
jgi:hypothetical protein